MMMLKFLNSPLLYFLFLWDYESFVFWSYIIGVVIAAPVWAWVTAQYLRKHKVEQWLLEVIMTITVAHSILFKSWWSAIPLCVLSLIVFGQERRHQNLEIIFTVSAHWLTAYTCHGGGMISFYFLTGLFLFSTVFMNVIFRYPEWKQWIKGEYVSTVPTYALSTIFMMVMQFNFIQMFTS